MTPEQEKSLEIIRHWTADVPSRAWERALIEMVDGLRAEVDRLRAAVHAVSLALWKANNSGDVTCGCGGHHVGPGQCGACAAIWKAHHALEAALSSGGGSP